MEIRLSHALIVLGALVAVALFAVLGSSVITPAQPPTPTATPIPTPIPTPTPAVQAGGAGRAATLPQQFTVRPWSGLRHGGHRRR